jgi:D-cysteine desulfhydrase/L-cysteate sulfo-lyase
LEGVAPPVLHGNVLVDHLLGAEIHFVDDREQQKSKMAELMERERSRGHRPHNLNENPMFDIASAIAYIECMMECSEQLSTLGVTPSYVYMSSSGKGQAGLELFKLLLAADLKVHGITATSEFNVPKRLAEIASRTAHYLGLDVHVDEDLVINFDDYVGPGYGIPSTGGNEAVTIFARTEGVILDPIYSGKCAAAMIQQIRSGMVSKGDLVLFIHTGGTPAIFTYPQLWS